MPTDSEFDSAVSRIGEYVGKIGDEIHAEAHTEDNDRLVGYQCIHGPYTYTVIGDPSDEFFTIQFNYNIIEDFKGVIDDSDAEDIIEGSQFEHDTGDVAGLAAMEILDSMSPSNKESLAYHLTQQLTNTDVAFSLGRTQSGTVIEFNVARKIFPYESTFCLSEYNHSVQTVVSSGHGALQFIGHSFDLESAINNQLKDGLDDDRDLRYIH